MINSLVSEEILLQKCANCKEKKQLKHYINHKGSNGQIYKGAHVKVCDSCKKDYDE